MDKKKLAMMFNVDDDDAPPFQQKQLDEYKLAHYSQGVVRKSKREKEKEAAEAKRREEEEQAAQAYADFIDVFDSEGPKQKAVLEEGGSYVPVAKVLISRRGKKPLRRRSARSNFKDRPPSPGPAKPKPKGQRAMDAFLEEIKRDQAERESRFKKYAGSHGSSVSAIAAYESQSGSRDRGDPATTNIFVANLPANIDENSLGMFFARIGPVDPYAHFLSPPLPSLPFFNSGEKIWAGGAGVGRGVQEGIGKRTSGGDPGLGQGIIIGKGKGIVTARGIGLGTTIDVKHLVIFILFDSVSLPLENTYAKGPWLPRNHTHAEEFIRKVVDKVRRNGRAFQTLLETRRRITQALSFWDDKNPGHLLYKHLLDGASLPPPPPVFDEDGPHSAYSTDSGEESERERIRKGTLGKLARKRFHVLLRGLSGKRGELARCMAFSLEHAESAAEPASITNAWKFRQEFESRLGGVFDHLCAIHRSFPGRITAETFKKAGPERCRGVGRLDCVYARVYERVEEAVGWEGCWGREKEGEERVEKVEERKVVSKFKAAAFGAVVEPAKEAEDLDGEKDLECMAVPTMVNLLDVAPGGVQNAAPLGVIGRREVTCIWIPWPTNNPRQMAYERCLCLPNARPRCGWACPASNDEPHPTESAGQDGCGGIAGPRAHPRHQPTGAVGWASQDDACDPRAPWAILTLTLSPNPAAGVGGGPGGLALGRPNLGPDPPKKPGQGGTPFANFSKIVDPSGVLRFGGGKAVIHSAGVDFSNGSSFKINMSEFRLEEELGRGNYGTVKKVYHKPTNVVMAMKASFTRPTQLFTFPNNSAGNPPRTRRCQTKRNSYGTRYSPSRCRSRNRRLLRCILYRVMCLLLYGIHGCRQLDTLNGVGVPEDVLARITANMVRGLKFLKDELQIMHRDVKPTNVLVSRKGAIKLCDFGVSGQLERSLAKTNIGCQSYMAPERIKGESLNNVGTYTVSSDVWSLGLSIIELAVGAYPYPPETYSNVFAQLTAIVHGPRRNYLKGSTVPMQPSLLLAGESLNTIGWGLGLMEFHSLIKEPTKRATYAELLDHPWLVADRDREVDMAGWVEQAVDFRKAKRAAGAEAAVKAGDVVADGKPTDEKPAESSKPVEDAVPVENGASEAPPDTDPKPVPAE
ncbi:kinase-like protein [Rhizoctonia solani]|uniref:mitogen-activated protein kinase kinase n=1 Tax=Rhizoctonia solani TaxID=456999 RepID=A0A8H7IF74_9AGAM|nr:kinase-like protein [Rhizoctonia solani]